MSPLVNILVATSVISLVALVGILTLAMAEETLDRILLFLTALSAGAMMGGAFVHLLPEALVSLGSGQVFDIVLISFVIFFAIEKVLHWRHCHKGKCDVHTFGHMNLIGDSVHNFIDGLIISAAFVSDYRLGLITTLAVGLHEIPQEIGDFGVLLHAGWKKRSALMANFVVALMVILGGFVGYGLSAYTGLYIKYLLPFAAGGFIYIAASDLMPEIRKETSLVKSMGAFLVFLLGIVLMYGVRMVGE